MKKVILYCLCCCLPFLVSAQETPAAGFELREEKPVFPGCEKLETKLQRAECSSQKLNEFIGARIQFPALAKRTNIEGKVIVGFDVKPDGSVDNVRILHDIGGGCGVEAVRVINLMNKEKIKWRPGVQQDKPVKVNFTIPINFYYEEDETEINVYTASKEVKTLKANSFSEIVAAEEKKLLIRKQYLKKISEEKFSPKLENGKRLSSLEMIYYSSISAEMQFRYFSKSGKLNSKMRKKMRSIIIGDMIKFTYQLLQEDGSTLTVIKTIYSAEE
ncbi:MAG: energy transducer TonB [Saprospiraceae bacterium]